MARPAIPAPTTTISSFRVLSIDATIGAMAGQRDVDIVRRQRRREEGKEDKG